MGPSSSAAFSRVLLLSARATFGSGGLGPAEFCRVLSSSAVVDALAHRVLLCPAEVCCSLRARLEGGGHGPAKFCRVLTSAAELALHARLVWGRLI